MVHKTTKDKVIDKLNNQQKEPKMNTKLTRESMLNKMFAKVPNVVMDVMTGALAIEDKEDTYSLGEDNTLNTGALFTMPIPAFATRVKEADINPGDILMHNGKAHGFVIAGKTKTKTPKSIRVISTSGATSTMHVKNDILMGEGYMIVKNMFGNDNLQSMLPMIMMMQDNDGEDSDLSSIYPMLMLSGMNGNKDGNATGGMNPMLLMAMAGNKGDSSSMSDMLPLMMMGNMQGGGNSGQMDMNSMLPMLMMSKAFK